jgi:hypothetical protein
MDNRQINKARMYFATELVLDNHLDLIAPFPEISTAQQQFKGKLTLIGQYRQVQETNNSGLTVIKVKLRNDVIKLIQKFRAALQALATSTKDDDLKAKASYTDTELKRASDPVLYDIGLLILKLASPIRSDLQRFFLVDEDYNSLESLLADFRSSIPKKRIATGTTKVSTSNIKNTFDAIDLLLKEEMDKLMAPFEFTQPDFYNEYKSARSIVGYNGGGNGENTTDTPTQ